MPFRPPPGRRARWAALAAAIVVGACTGGGADSEPGEQEAVEQAPDTDNVTLVGVTTGGDLSVLLAEDPTPQVGWTPWDHVCAWACQNVMNAVLETLMISLPDGRVVPYLAESIDANENLTEWRVTVREGITFSDGEPLTAAAIHDGHQEFVKDGKVTEQLLRDAGVTSVTLDGEVIVYSTSEPNAAIPTLLAGPVGRVFSVEAARVDPAAFLRGPVGTGPFVFTPWTVGSPVRLERNPDYWRRDADGTPLPYLSSITFADESDGPARLDAVRVGSAQVAQSRNGLLAEQATDLELQVIRRVEDNASVIVLNTLEEPLDDLRVRRALAFATDRAALAATASDVSDPELAAHWWGPESVWHSDTAETAWPDFDRDEARRLLQSYVDDRDRSDGKDEGEPIEVHLACTDDLRLSNMIRDAAAMWEATGLVDVETETVSRTGLIQRVVGDISDRPQFRGDYEAACWRQGGESDPAVLLVPAFSQVKTSPLNVTNVESERLLELAADVRDIRFFSSRSAAVNEIMLALATEVPAIPLAYSVSAIIARPEIQGIHAFHLPDGTQVLGQRGGVARYAEVWIDG